MIKIANAQLWVHDQDEALAFYTQKVGLEVRIDVTMAEMGNFRWLAVGPAGAAGHRDRADGHPRPAGHGRRDGGAGADPDGEGLRGDGLPRRPTTATPRTRSSRAAASSSPRRPRSARTGSTRASAIRPATRPADAGPRCLRRSESRGCAGRRLGGGPQPPRVVARGQRVELPAPRAGGLPRLVHARLRAEPEHVLRLHHRDPRRGGERQRDQVPPELLARRPAGRRRRAPASRRAAIRTSRAACRCRACRSTRSGARRGWRRRARWPGRPRRSRTGARPCPAARARRAAAAPPA